MSEWDFDDASTAIDEAEAVLADRDRLRATVADLGLAFPPSLEPVFETADSADDLDGLSARLAQWQGAADAIRSARDRLAARRPVVTSLGLIGTEPEADYRAALAAFAAGDDRAAVGGSAATLTLLSGAEDLGRQRALAGASVGLLVLLLLVVLVAVLVYRRRSRRRARQLALASTIGSAPEAPLEPAVEPSPLPSSDPEPEAQPPPV
jgi:hypothetical protein